jgi:hypothetical protein
MKSIKIFILTTIFTFGFLMSCKDDSLEGIPDWETGVNGLGEFSETSEDVNFIKGDPSVDLTVDLLWNSIDKKNTVVKMELYILFNEAFLDENDNPKTAKHGGDEGVLFMTLEGDDVPANKEVISFTISQDDVYALYEGATYDYGTGELPVWGVGSIRADRNTADFKFVDGDTFQLIWKFTTADGRVFDNWGISVCTELPGSSCSVNWGTACSQIIAEPVGTWTINFKDSYGDGWNGAAIRVTTNTGFTDYTLANGSSGSTDVVIPPGTTSLTFAYVSGDWDSEASFTIVSEKGNTIAKGGPSQAEGILSLNLCKENE